MRVLFDARRYSDPPETVIGEDAAQELQFLDRACDEILSAMRGHIVYAKVFTLPDGKYPVKDVRILEQPLEKQPYSNMVICSESLQVLLLEGWRTAELVWTDENIIEEVKGIH